MAWLTVHWIQTNSISRLFNIIPHYPYRRYWGIFITNKWRWNGRSSVFRAKYSMDKNYECLIFAVVNLHSLILQTDAFHLLQVVSPCRIWWAILDSNQWPLACRASALANWANRPRYFANQNKFNHKDTKNTLAGSPVLDWTKMFRFRLQAWTSVEFL